MKWKDLSLKERKQVYDSIRANNPDVTYFDIKEQFDSIPAYEDGKEIISQINNSNANFVSRLKNPFRKSIKDWETQYVNPYIADFTSGIAEFRHPSIATHKMSAWEGDNGTGLIVPTVQEVKGELIDFSRPPYNKRAALENALKTGDFVETSKYQDAEWYTQNYKKYYPSFEDGGKLSKTKRQLGLIPGTPEYFARQQAISGRVDVVQPEAYLTPAGYVKDALSVAEAIDEGNYGEAAATTLLNAIPWGVGKIFRGVKSKVGEALNTPIEVKSVDLTEPFTPTATKRRKKSKVIEDDTQHKEAATRRSKNIKNYEKEISSTIEDAVFPDPQTMALLKYVDEGFGTNYKRSYADIAYRDMSNRGKYVTYEGMEPGHYGSMRGRKIEGDTYSINDFGVYLNPDYYMPGTASHELSHLADALNNPYTSTNMTTMKDTHYGNNYLDYLADYENMLSPEEIQKTGKTHLMGTRKYLSDPTEVKSHMIGLKRALINAGKLANWNSKVTVDMLKDYFDPRNYQNLVNPMNRNMFDLYRNKQGFVNRMNMLIPMEYAVPLGVSGFVGYELNDE